MKIFKGTEFYVMPKAYHRKIYNKFQDFITLLLFNKDCVCISTFCYFNCSRNYREGSCNSQDWDNCKKKEM